MTRTRIIRTDRFDLVSVGNGTLYELFDDVAEESVCFQGDDAVAFREALEAFEAAQPESSYEGFLFDQMYP